MLAEENARHQGLIIYTNGLGYKGGIGAAAYAEDNHKVEHVRCSHLGSDGNHTVFEGEVVGAILALDIVRACPRTRRATIKLDNHQAAIRALASGRGEAGKYLLDLFHTELTSLQSARCSLRIHICWVPGHEGIEGNKRVDIEAKAAAEGNTTSLTHRSPTLSKDLPSSTSALKAGQKKRARAEWQSEWEDSKHGKRLHRIDPTPPSKPALNLYKGRSRQAGSIITQLRTGHAALNGFLSRIKAVDSPLCTRCCIPETVEHFLLTCQRYNLARHSLRMAIKGPFSLFNILAKNSNLSKTLSYV